MKIRLKTVLLILGTTSILLLAYVVFSNVVLLSSFSKLENHLVKREAQVVTEVLEAYTRTVEIKISDWAAWDDAYNYVQTKNKKFETSNFDPKVLENLNISALVFFDQKGKILSKAGFDIGNKKAAEVSVSLVNILEKRKDLKNFTLGNQSSKGIIRTEEGLMVYVTKPVVDTKMLREPKGTVFFGRYIDRELVTYLAQMLKQNLSLVDLKTAAEKHSIDTNKLGPVFKTLEDRIWVFVVLPDKDRTPAGVFIFDRPRDIFFAGKKLVDKTIMVFFVMTALFALALIKLIDKLIINRLVQAQQQINHIIEQRSEYIQDDTEDEIGALAKTTNSLVDSLNKRNDEMYALNEVIKTQQAALVTSAKLSALGEMAGGIAHEINTPLAVIKMRTEILQNENWNIDEEKNDKLIRSLAIINKTVDRIHKIVQSLRTFARETNNAEKQPHRVTSIITDSLDLCSEKFKANGIDLKFECEKDLKVLCRPTEISQVVINLLNNSFDAVENCAEKTVLIEVKPFEAWGAEISITDSGTGVPDHIRDKIMQPFFTTKEIGRGTGMGLSISKGIVEEHGGKLYLDNNSKKTKMVVILPLARDSEESYYGEL